MENTQDLINQIGLGLLALTPRTCGQNLLKFAVGGRLPIGYIVDFDFSTVGVPIDPVFFPALPSYEICTNFRDSCTGFIPRFSFFLFFLLKKKKLFEIQITVVE